MSRPNRWTNPKRTCKPVFEVMERLMPNENLVNQLLATSPLGLMHVIFLRSTTLSNTLVIPGEHHFKPCG